MFKYQIIAKDIQEKIENGQFKAGNSYLQKVKCSKTL